MFKYGIMRVYEEAKIMNPKVELTLQIIKIVIMLIFLGLAVAYVF